VAYNTARSAAQCRSNPVSGRSLQKTGIIQLTARDFRRFQSAGAQIGSLETDNRIAKPAIGGLFCHQLRSIPDSPHCLAGIRTFIFPTSKMADIRSTSARRELFGSSASARSPRQVADLGVDTCGLTQLASGTVGVSFIGLRRSTGVWKILRRLHGGEGMDVGRLVSFRANVISLVARYGFIAECTPHLEQSI
jgi:hypothetical protein